MSHTTTYAAPYGDILFHHNGDFDGAVNITLPDGITIAVPFAALKHLVAAYARQRAISRIEELSDSIVLGIMDSDLSR